MDIFDKTKDRIVLFDGAMGTELYRKGLKIGECPELMNLTNQDVVYEIHKSYIDAGSDVIETNTFGANRARLKGYNLEGKLSEIIENAIKIAEKASNGKPIALSVGPTGLFMKPVGDVSYEELYDIYSEVARASACKDIGLVIIETMMYMEEMKAAIKAFKENTNMEIICSMTYGENGKTIMGEDAENVSLELNSLGINAMGANCSTGPDKMIDVIKKIVKVSNVPVIAQPNAGLPELKDGKLTYNMTINHFVDDIDKIIKCGAKIVGGCCGTTPEFIRSMRTLIDNYRR